MTEKMNFRMEIKSLSDNGYFTGYASVFDYVDNQNDMIMRGAFGRTLSEKNFGEHIKFLWQHDPAQPIGFFVNVKEDDVGLWVEGFLLQDVQKGREAYSLLKTGAISGLSIGYNVKNSDYDSRSGVRVISDLDLYEISLVTFPANDLAKVVNVKTQEFNLYPGQLIHLSDALDEAVAALRV